MSKGLAYKALRWWFEVVQDWNRHWAMVESMDKPVTTAQIKRAYLRSLRREGNLENKKSNVCKCN